MSKQKLENEIQKAVECMADTGFREIGKVYQLKDGREFIAFIKITEVT